MGIPSEVIEAHASVCDCRREAPKDMPLITELEEEVMRSFGRGTIAARQRLVPIECMRRLKALLGRGLTLDTSGPAPASPAAAASFRSAPGL